MKCISVGQFDTFSCWLFSYIFCRTCFSGCCHRNVLASCYFQDDLLFAETDAAMLKMFLPSKVLFVHSCRKKEKQKTMSKTYHVFVFHKLVAIEINFYKAKNNI